MRLIVCLCLLIGCNTHTNIPVGGTVSEGTFLSLGPSNENTGRITLTFLDSQGVVNMDVYSIAQTGFDGPNVYSERLVVAGNQPLAPGDQFKVVASGPAIVEGTKLPVYTIVKLE